MVGGTVQYTLLLRFSPFETKEWRKNCNVTRTLRLDCREESISEFGAAEGMGQTHQQGTLQSSSGKNLRTGGLPSLQRGLLRVSMAKEGIVVSYETEHFAEGFGNDNGAHGYGVVNCESTLEEKYIAEERYNTLCARIYRYADSAYPDGAKIIACYLNGKTLESTAKELHLTVRAVHYRLHQMLKYIREHRSTFCDF